MLASLPRVGDTSPTSQSYGLTWRNDSFMAPRPDARVAVTIAGLAHLPEAAQHVDAFMTALRYLVRRQAELTPSPDEVVEAQVTSEEIELALSGAWPDGSTSAATMRKLRQYIATEPFLYNVIIQPDQALESWTARVPAILRAYRGVATPGEYVTRLAELITPERPPTVPLSFSALDIPYAIGYLDAVWKNRTGSPLFVNLDPASVARLTQPCTDDGDFNSLMSALADVLGQVVPPGKIKPPQRGALEEVRDFIVQALDGDPAGRVEEAVDMLIRLRRIRVSTQHADARHKAVDAFREIGLAFPPYSWDHTWTYIAGLAKGALDVIREEVHAGLG
jgi:hypothetical protein